MKAKPVGAKDIGLIKSIELCRKAGIPFVKGFTAKSPAQAGISLKKTGLPCAIKIISSKASHKTDFGGVVSGINSEEDAFKAFEAIRKNAARKKIPFEGVLVQEQARGIEVIIGAKRDAQFGPVVLFGFGGIFAETIRDFSLRLAPVGMEEAMRMMLETKGAKVLGGERGKEGADMKALSKIICSASKLMISNPKIAELDLNPVFAGPKRAVAVDARVIS